MKMRVRLYQSMVQSILLYACETWPLNKTIAKKLAVFQHKCLRSIHNITYRDRITNDEVRRRSNVEHIVTTITRRRWTWLGHLLRRPEQCIDGQALEFAAPGSRSRGRPPPSWMSTIRGDCTTLGYTLDQLKDIAQDRGSWRAVVVAVCADRRLVV